MKSVARRICDRKMLRVIRMWLKAPVEETDADGRRQLTGGRHSRAGTPQGGVISPLLANLYIHRLLRAWKKLNLRGRIINYADDLVIVCRDSAEEALQWLKWIIERLGLNSMR
jgi:RNA-directed DNA polymerase